MPPGLASSSRIEAPPLDSEVDEDEAFRRVLALSAAEHAIAAECVMDAKHAAAAVVGASDIAPPPRGRGRGRGRGRQAATQAAAALAGLVAVPAAMQAPISEQAKTTRLRAVAAELLRPLVDEGLVELDTLVESSLSIDDDAELVEYLTSFLGDGATAVASEICLRRRCQ